MKRSSLLLSEVRESFYMALSAISTHKLRSGLTLLGVTIGVFSIIVVMTAMRVMQGNIEKEISQLGSHTFLIRKMPAIYFGGPEGYEKFFRRKDITYQQMKLFESRATLPRCVGASLGLWSGQIETRYKKSGPSVQLNGGTPGSFQAKNLNLAEGRLLMEVDLENARDVCVLGSKLAQTIFPPGGALGQRVKINGINYTVVGVLEPKGNALGGEQDNFAVIPLTTGINRFGRWNKNVDVLVEAPDAATFQETMEQARGIWRTIRKVPPGAPDDFEISSNDSMITQFNSFTLAVRLGVAVVSSIALLAAGVGIMNIMLVSVTERTREIGIRRAIGAKKRNIMAQFVLEAVALCQFGGLAGVALGILGGNGVAYLLKLPPAIPVDWTLIGLVICSVVGVIFGSYPAYKAATLDPIESLRYE